MLQAIGVKACGHSVKQCQCLSAWFGPSYGSFYTRILLGTDLACCSLLRCFYVLIAVKIVFYEVCEPKSIFRILPGMPLYRILRGFWTQIYIPDPADVSVTLVRGVGTSPPRQRPGKITLEMSFWSFWLILKSSTSTSTSTGPYESQYRDPSTSTGPYGPQYRDPSTSTGPYGPPYRDPRTVQVQVQKIHEMRNQTLNWISKFTLINYFLILWLELLI